jgi:hypothetical protein
MSTERAAKLAQALTERGWMIANNHDRQCLVCGATSEVREHVPRYCSLCGARLRLRFDSDALEELESAMLAVLGPVA